MTSITYKIVFVKYLLKGVKEMTYKVKYITSIISGCDTVFVSASNEEEAKEIGNKLLNKNKLHPSFLNDGYIICIPV